MRTAGGNAAAEIAGLRLTIAVLAEALVRYDAVAYHQMREALSAAIEAVAAGAGGDTAVLHPLRQLAETLDRSHRPMRPEGPRPGCLPRASYLAGFSGTATTAAGLLWPIPIFGTMAHSFIQAHGDESAAFEHFARSRPDGLVLLIDTYDTERGAERVVALAPKQGGAALPEDRHQGMRRRPGGDEARVDGCQSDGLRWHADYALV